MKINRCEVVFSNSRVADEQNSNLGQAYRFMTFIEDLEENDLVVVNTRYGLATAVFVGYIDNNEVGSIDLSRIEEYKFVVSKVDTSDYDNKIEKITKFKEVKEKIDLRIKKVLEEREMRLLAESDEELASLISEMDGILK